MLPQLLAVSNSVASKLYRNREKRLTADWNSLTDHLKRPQDNAAPVWTQDTCAGDGVYTRDAAWHSG